MKRISIHDIAGFRIGHAQDPERATGCTAIIADNGATAGVDVRGGGPATRETDLLNPQNMVQQVHCVLLSGGSAFGLEAGSGAMQYLSENNIGFDLKGIYIPIVCQASLFDCNVGDLHAFPDKMMGYYACVNSEIRNREQGNVGAGTGASVGKFFGFDKAMKSGLGYAACQINRIQVGAVVAVNACGDVFESNSKTQLAGPFDGRKLWNTEETLIRMVKTDADPITNTTLGCVLTNADLNKAQMNKIASMAHNGYAHCIRPVHTSNDGDTIFALSTRQVPAALDLIGILAEQMMETAIENAIKKAESNYGLPGYSSIQSLM